MSIKHILRDVTKRDTVHIHSVPASAQIYDSIWSELAGRALEYTEGRTYKLAKLLAPTLFYGKKKLVSFPHDFVVLDVCAGHGGYSIAALEMGAGMVYMCDGSYVVLHKQTQKLKHTPPLYENFNDRLVRVQVDVEEKLMKHLPQSHSIWYFNDTPYTIPEILLRPLINWQN